MDKTECSGVVYRPLEAKDIDSLSKLYAEAFSDNTCYNYIFQYDEDTHPVEFFASKKWLFERRLGIIMDYDLPCYVAVNESGDIIGGASGVKKDIKPGLFAFLKAGILTWPFYWGLKSVTRALSVDDEFDAIDKNLYPESEAQLSMVAVSPSCQGKGVGKRLVLALLEDDRMCGLSISLSTQREQNQRFYESLGFRDATEHSFFGFKSWTMFRPK